MADRLDLDFDSVFPVCRRILGEQRWQLLVAVLAAAGNRQELLLLLKAFRPPRGEMPAYLADLFRLELAIHEARRQGAKPVAAVEELTVNPSLQLCELAWSGLVDLIGAKPGGEVKEPQAGASLALVWHDPLAGTVRCLEPKNEELLVLKMAVEGIGVAEAAREGGVAVAALDAALDRAAGRGLLLKPPSKIRRDAGSFPGATEVAPRFLAAEVFTLQWHITQACDLHCKHCYDRSERAPLPLAKGIAILDELFAFCRSRNVQGQVTFSGGNPLLYPHFLDLYRAAAERGFLTAILGNATTRERLLPLLAIQKPAFYQVSLEGLAEHNDYIRGKGYFARVMDFLAILAELDIYSMVMLTLTRGNMEQVLPLAELLRDRVDRFVFNRLAMVGEGSLLESVPVGGFREFLEGYLAAAVANPCMGAKDNLFNIIRDARGQELFGGCAGFGCGAAFNFLSLLPDGEVHACRKFPSEIGNIFNRTLAEIYDSPAAERYRAGCGACRDCRLRQACGGCLAVSHGFGLDVFAERDPYCFIEKK
ncbi:thio(seleno)oxazole modification radical SAM maturase SbtM [Thiovibrio sp. JS02]